MDPTIASLIALAGGVLVILAFFAVFRGRGKFSLKSIFGKFTAEGENPPPPTAVAGGVKIKAATAGRDLSAHSSGAGGVDSEKVKARGNLTATHTPGAAPPKS